MRTLREFRDYQLGREQKLLSNITKFPEGKHQFYHAWWMANRVIGLQATIEGHLNVGKMRYSLCALLDQRLIIDRNSRIFDYGFIHVDLAVLSDHEALLRDYVNLSYRGDQINYPDMDVMVTDGEGVIWCHTMLMTIKQDWHMVARNVEIIRKKVLPKKG